jgi:DDE superfamily endonuclease
LIGETRQPLPVQPGPPARSDYEYKRHGPRTLFLFCEPQAGWRHVAVTAQRTRGDCAQPRQWLGNERSPHADVIRGVLDNLTTPKPGSLYQPFPPAAAPRVRQQLEFHYTPKHGRWLNRAEIDLRVFARQWLQRRSATEATLVHELAEIEAARNTARATIHWQFTTAAARVKLAHLYPSNSL